MKDGLAMNSKLLVQQMKMIAMEVLRKGTLIDKDEKDRNDHTGAYCIPGNEYSEVGRLLRL